MFSNIYQKLVPKEWRLRLYKFRNPQAIEAKLNAVNPSKKGTFSMRPFTEKRCVFVHITKTAGTSVALTLFDALPYHYQAWQYRVFYGRKQYDEFFKFAFVRNPWDRLYSAFAYLKGGGWDDNDKQWSATHLSGVDDFNDFVLNWLTPERLQSHMHFYPQSDFICDAKGKPIINFLAYFETINDDFVYIADKVGCTEPLVHKNASKRESYTSVYSEQAKAKVAQLYATDVANFGYSFDGLQRRQIKDGRFVDEA